MGKTRMDETVAEIVAEMRELAESLGTKRRVNIPTLTVRTWLGLADRLEAAHKREYHCKKRYDQNGDEMPPHCAFDDLKIDRLQAKVGELTAELERERVGFPDRLGDAAKMRKGLEQLCRMCSHNGHDFGIPAVRELLDHLDMMKAVAQCALAAPAHNCDKFLSRDKAWATFERWYFGPTESEFILDAFIDWLFSTDGKVDEAAKNGGNQ